MFDREQKRERNLVLNARERAQREKKAKADAGKDTDTHDDDLDEESLNQLTSEFYEVLFLSFFLCVFGSDFYFFRFHFFLHPFLTFFCWWCTVVHRPGKLIRGCYFFPITLVVNILSTLVCYSFLSKSCFRCWILYFCYSSRWFSPFSPVFQFFPNGRHYQRRFSLSFQWRVRFGNE